MRLKNVFRNSFFSMLSQIVLIVVGFFSQRVMNLRMGEELVGMNGVFSNVIAILSVSELGISTAVVYHLYKALAEKNESEIAALMNLYRKAYYIFAAVITALGIAVLPVVHYFLKENSFTLGYIRIVFFLWLARTVLSYLLSYRRSILIADQKEYIVSIVTLTANVLNYLSVIIILELIQNYILVLLINIFVEAVLNIWISCYVNRAYPFLKKMYKKPLQKQTISKIAGDIKNIFVTRFSAKILLSTDNLIISGFINVATVGLYSNYCLITNSVINVLVALSNAIQPSVGNMFIEGDNEKNYRVLRQLTFVFFLLAGFAAVSLFCLITRFVTDLWLGEKYRMDMFITMWLVMNCFIQILGMPLSVMMGVTGLFQKERNLSVIAAAANLAVSLALVKPFGVSGVLAGTFVSYIIQLLFRIRVFFYEYLKMDCKKYIADLIQYGVLSILEIAGIYVITANIYQQKNMLSFFAILFLCIFLPNLINSVIYIKSWRLKSIVSLIKGIK